MSAGFLTPLRIEKVGASRWRLLDPLRYFSGRYRGVFVVPAGFESDLASVPRLFWTVLPKVDKYDAAAVLHDAGYEHALTTLSGRPVYTTKPVADGLFHEACLSLGVGHARAALMYGAVKVWGTPKPRKEAA